MDQDREAALAAARNIASGGSGSRNQSRESSRDGRRGQSRSDSREARRPPTAPSSTMPPSKPPAVAAQTPEEVERKTKAILDEYLSNHELEEAVLCVREIEPASIHLFVYHIINNVLERTQESRELVGNLLHDLVKKQVLTVDQYLQG